MTDLPQSATSPPPAAPAGPPSPAASASSPGPASPGGRRLWRNVRLGAWLLVVGMLVAGLAGWFFLLRDGRLVLDLGLLQTGWLAGCALCAAIWILLATTPKSAVRLSPWASKRILITVSALLAAAALLWLRPVLSSEVLRYRFDGRIWLLGLSPYTASPAEAAELSDPDLRPDALDLSAPRPQSTTLNLPVSQAAFVTAQALEYTTPSGEADQVMPPFAAPATHPAASTHPGWRGELLQLPWWRQMLVWRCLLAGALLLTLGELIAWLRSRDLSPWWAATFAWQPLVLVETLGASHQDIIGVLFLVAGLRRADLGNFRRAGICLAASIAVKPLALLVLPFVIRRAWRSRESGEAVAPSRRGPGEARRLVVWLAVTLLLLLMPVWAGGALRELTGAGGEFLRTAEHNASFYRLLESMFAGEGASPQRQMRLRLAAWIVCGLATLLVGLIAWNRRVRPAAAFYAMTLVGLLLSPVGSPWLLVWPLAVVPVLAGRAGPAALVWAGTAALFYTPETLAGGRAPASAVMLQFTPVFVFAALEAAATRRQWLGTRERRPPATPSPAAQG